MKAWIQEQTLDIQPKFHFDVSGKFSWILDRFREKRTG